MSKYDNAEKIMEFYKIGLVYPYHIDHSLKRGNCYYNENYTEFHEHNFHSVVITVWNEPDAFYLTEEDMEYYSQQELEVIEKIQKESF